MPSADIAIGEHFFQYVHPYSCNLWNSVTFSIITYQVSIFWSQNYIYPPLPKMIFSTCHDTLFINSYRAFLP
jgi:hypothetical protein